MEELILACSIDLNHLDIHHVEAMEGEELSFDSPRQLLCALQVSGEQRLCGCANHATVRLCDCGVEAARVV